MKLYQNLAEMYDLLYSYRDYSKETQLLIGNLSKKESVKLLDVACGTGVHLEAVRKKLPLAKLVGIDLNEGMLDVARNKSLDAELIQSDMRYFDLGRDFDLVYCLSSSIQYNLSQEDFEKTILNMRKSAVNGKVIFDLAYSAERWREGYTNITANSNEKFEIAELYTSHSGDGFSHWNPLYLIKDKETGKIDMHVDKQTIKLWSVDEVKNILELNDVPYSMENGFSGENNPLDIPVFVLEGLKN